MDLITYILSSTAFGYKRSMWSSGTIRLRINSHDSTSAETLPVDRNHRLMKIKSGRGQIVRENAKYNAR